MTKDEVISKVEKLLRLAESPNENEAASAAAMAQELMEKYQIEALQINRENDVRVGLSVGSGVVGAGRYEGWHKHFFQGLAEVHDCKPYFGVGTGRTRLRVIGFDSDIEALKLMYDYLLGTILRLYKAAWKKEKAALLEQPHVDRLHRSDALYFRRGFCKGCAQRIISRLRDAKEAREQSECDVRALVVVKDAAVSEAYAQLTFTGGSMEYGMAGSRFGYAAGHAAGGSVSLNAPVGHIG